MSFPDPQPSGIAVFQRAGWQWIVLSRPVNLSPLEKEKKLQSLHIQSTPTGQIIRFALPENKTATTWHEKGSWHIHWVATPPETKQVLEEWTDTTGLHWKIPGASPAFTVTDPLLGDFLWIFTTSDPTVSVPQTRQFALLSLEPTTLGLVVSSFQQTLPLTQTGGTVTLAPMGDRSPLSKDKEETPSASTATLTTSLNVPPQQNPSPENRGQHRYTGVPFTISV
jgi:hypothetical protein